MENLERISETFRENILDYEFFKISIGELLEKNKEYE
tara:strand:- start:264 stop:374 length:111 start_codon:yes stop_codon:yes gene_type:complete